MKRSISILLSVTLILGLFAGCSAAGDDRSGTEIARLLLANERLDAGVFGADTGGNVLGFIPVSFETPSPFTAQASGTPLKVAVEAFPSASRLSSAGKLPTTSVGSFGGSDFEERCDMLSAFQSYMEGIRFTAENAAALIDAVKQNVSYTDVWIPGSEFGIEGRVMLSVDANTEILLEETDGGLRVCRRYTDENANDVYEIFSQQEADVADQYLLYIPGKRYEYSEINKVQPNSNMYVVADNSRGYWNMFTTSFIDDPQEVRANTQNLISAGNATYANHGAIYSSGYRYSDYTQFTDVGCNSDVLAISDNIITVTMAAFRGISTVTTDGNDFITGFATTSGKTVNVGDTFADGTVSFHDGHAAESGEFTYGTLTFHFPEGSTAKSNIYALMNILAELGITCKYDITSIAENTATAVELGQNFGQYYTWNGYLMSDLGNVEKAAEVDAAKHRALVAEYEKRKDNKELERTAKGFNYAGYDFATVSALTADAVSYQDGKVVVSGLNVTVEDLTVFDAGEQYSVHLALARLNDSAASAYTTVSADITHNNITLLGTTPASGTVDADYASAILLAGDNTASTAYTSGDSFSLSQTAAFTLPDCSEQGVYTVAAYVATADGIRVSEMVPLPFTTDVSYSGTAASGLPFTLRLNDYKEMIAVYGTERLSFTLPEKAEGYTYDEVYTELKTFILNHGYPIESALPEVYDPATDTGKAADTAATYRSTVCRMKYSDRSDNSEKYIYVIIP